MDGNTEQARALAETAGVRARPDLALLRLDGDDQRAWLNGQVTHDVRETGPGDAVYALAVTVRGKISKSQVQGKIGGGGNTLRLRASGGRVRIDPL